MIWNFRCRMMTSTVILCGIIAIAPVTAQATASPDNAASQSADLSSSGEPNSGDIVVTAQKREQLLQNVPISVSVLAGSALDSSSLRSVGDALGLVAGLKVSTGNQGGGTQISIRGVAAAGALLTGGSTVGYYVDSLPFGFVTQAVSPDMDAYDLQRVEVLRGPQGTLYGASALNGVVRVLTNPADLDKFEMKARATFSTTHAGGEGYRGDAALNVPIIPGALAVRVVAGYDKIAGWIDRPNKTDANDGHLGNVRVKVNAKPADNLSVELSYWRSRTHFDAPAIGFANDTNPSLRDQPEDIGYDLLAAQIKYDLPSFSIYSSTSHIDYKSFSNLDLIPPYNFNINFMTNFYSKVFAQEVRLASTAGGPWKWSLGGIYRAANDRLTQEAGFIFRAPLDLPTRSKSFAVFGEVARLLADDHLEVTAGLRYFRDKVTQGENRPLTGLATQILYNRSDVFKSTTPRFVVSWHQDDNLTVYGSYSQGFRSGFPQNAQVAMSAPQFASVKADKLFNYEGGIKGKILDGLVRYDLAAYYIEWKNVQQSIQVPFNSVFITAMTNAGTARGPGIDAAIEARPFKGLKIGATGSVNDLKLADPVLSGGAVLFNKGDRLNFSAKYTAAIYGDYAFALNDDYRLSISASLNYSSAQSYRSQRGTGTVPIITTSDDQLIGRTNISFEKGKNWTATLFVDNFANETGTPNRHIIPVWSTRVRPRTLGVQLEAHF